MPRSSSVMAGISSSKSERSISSYPSVLIAAARALVSRSSAAEVADFSACFSACLLPVEELLSFVLEGLAIRLRVLCFLSSEAPSSDLLSADAFSGSLALCFSLAGFASTILSIISFLFSPLTSAPNSDAIAFNSDRSLTFKSCS